MFRVQGLGLRAKQNGLRVEGMRVFLGLSD